MKTSAVIAIDKKRVERAIRAVIPAHGIQAQPHRTKVLRQRRIVTNAHFEHAIFYNLARARFAKGEHLTLPELSRNDGSRRAEGDKLDEPSSGNVHTLFSVTIVNSRAQGF